MAKGDHIFVKRAKGLYSHHGIDCGDDMVIHYTTKSWRDTPRVQRTDMKQFADSGEVEVRDYTAIRDAVTEQSELQADTQHNINRLLDVIRGLPEVSGDINLSTDAVVERAESRIGETNYDIGFHNCEHFVTWCKTGISDSTQINHLWRLVLAAPEYQRQRFDSTMTRMLDTRWNPF